METVKREQEISPFAWDRIKTYAPLYVRYPAGELIYKEGSYVAGVYLISNGLVSDQCPSRQDHSRKPPLEILGPGDLIGLESLLEGQNDTHHSCTRAVTETGLYFFQSDVFMRVLKEEDEIGRYCLDFLCRRFYDLKHWCSALFNQPLEVRLYHRLLNLAEKCKENGDKETVVLPPEITKTTLSLLLGVSTSKVSKTIASLPEISVVEKQITVSLKALRLRLAGVGVDS